MERLTRYGFLQTNVCLSSDVEKLEARVKDLKDDLKSTIESSNEMSDRNGELTAELAGLKEGAFQAREQHDADQAEIARLTAELREGGREMNYTQMAEGFIQIPEEKWDAVQAELTALRNRYSTVCPQCHGNNPSDDGLPCPNPHCVNGRVMMLDAEEVKKQKRNTRNDHWFAGWDAAINYILEGKR